jgi:NNP family nitrate/nitrite transporter-like MFS transporter
MLLFLIVSVSLIWMHGAIRLMERQKFPALAGPKDLPELEQLRAELERLRVQQPPRATEPARA